MYTAQIGKKFLQLYNQKTGGNLSAMDFFEDEFFPVMFDSEDHLHLMHVHGSAFFQPSYSRLAEKEKISVQKYRKKKFIEVLGDVEKNNIQPHGGVGVGFMAGGNEETSSGQVSNIDLDLSQDNILHSWLGGALGAGFGGGYDLLFDNDEILWFLFKGWQYYRKYLQETTGVKGRQIETWSGLWLTYGLEYKGDLDRAYMNTLDNLDIHKQGKYIALKRPNWSTQIFSLARNIEADKTKQIVYAYSYGQMNKSLGFFYLSFAKIKRMPALFKQLIDKDDKLKRSQIRRIEQVYKTEFTFEKACSMGGIGIKSLKPRNIKKYQAGRVNTKKIRLNTEQRKLTFINYLTWVEAMLNNEQTLKLAEELAENIIKYEGKEKRLRTRTRQVEALWEAYNRQQFIEQLSSIIVDDSSVSKTLNQVVNQLMTDVTDNQFKLFSTLTKFKYNLLKNN
ncbi:MAG: hypothetical protein U9O78_05215 [Patescibacteria group bacterium]|nr:hypothetical protein [Patescibacteria group bacterium]